MIQTSFAKTSPDEWHFFLGTYAWEHAETRRLLQQVDPPQAHMSDWWDRRVDVTNHSGVTRQELSRLGVLLNSFFARGVEFDMDIQLAVNRREFDMVLGQTSCGANNWLLAVSRPVYYEEMFPTKGHALFQPKSTAHTVGMAYGRWLLFTGPLEVTIFDVAYEGLNSRLKRYGVKHKSLFGAPIPELRIKSRAKELDVYLMQAQVYLTHRQVIELHPTLPTKVTL